MPDMTLTPEDIARDATVDLAVCDAATPGPWSIGLEDDGPNFLLGSGYQLWGRVVASPERSASSDATFIALARTALPAWIKRAIAAEARLSRLETLCGELGTRSVSNAHNAEDAETLYECLLGLAEILKSIGENARRPAT